MTAGRRILVTEPLSDAGLELLRRDFEVDYQPSISDEELTAALPGADALIVRSKTQVSSERIGIAGRLKVIGRAGVGYDNIDLEAATERGILVMNVPDANTMAATEHTFALMLSLVRRIPMAVEQMRNQQWRRSELVGHELFQKTLGIVGFGRIGKEIARRALAFDMSVMVFDPYVTEEKAQSLNVQLADLDTLLTDSDLVTLHVPLSDATRGLIGKERLGKMKSTAYLINCARGGIVDDDDLVDALRDGTIAGAGLDVYVTEPPDFSAPLLSAGFPNLLCTPHLGASTQEAQERVGTSIARQVSAALLDDEFANSVNLPKIDPQELKQLRPYMKLGEQLGRFLARWIRTRTGKMELVCEGEVSRLDVEYVHRAVLKGFLSACFEQPVTYVNAPRLAEQHGIKIGLTRRSASTTAFSSSVSLSNEGEGVRRYLAGTVSPTGDARLIGVDEFELEIPLEGKMLLIFHQDRPGVVGRVGTILGDRGVNIGRMEVGRRGQGDDAIMVLTVDSEIDRSVMETLQQLDDMRDVSMIGL